MDKETQILRAFRPTSHNKLEQERFDSIEDIVLKEIDAIKIEGQKLFKRLIPVVDKISRNDFKSMEEMDKAFKELEKYTLEIRKVIHDEKHNLEVISDEITSVNEEYMRELQDHRKGISPLR